MPIDYERIRAAANPPQQPTIIPEAVKKYGSMIIRGAGGLSPGGPIGGFIGGGTELAAQALEGKRNLPAVAASAGLGAIPGGQQAKLLKTIGRGALESGMGTGIMQQTEGLHIPTDEELKQIGLATVIGGGTAGVLQGVRGGMGKKIPESPKPKQLYAGNPQKQLGPATIPLLKERNPFQAGPGPTIIEGRSTTPEVKIAGKGKTTAASKAKGKPKAKVPVDETTVPIVEERGKPQPIPNDVMARHMEEAKAAEARAAASKPVKGKGRSIKAEVAKESRPKFDPRTGRPINVKTGKVSEVSEANDWAGNIDEDTIPIGPNEAQFHSSEPTVEIPGQVNQGPTVEAPDLNTPPIINIDSSTARTAKPPTPTITVSDLGNPRMGGGPKVETPKQAGMKATDGIRGWFTKNIESKLPKDEKTGRINWSEIINAPKAIRASADLSGALRQGIVLSRRKAWRDSLMPMVRALRSENYEQELRALENHPRYKQAQESGVRFSAIDSKGVRGEEAFGSRLASKIPFLGKQVVARSERAYTTFLNSLRIKTFDEMVSAAERLQTKDRNAFGEIPLSNIANYVNTASGRGSLAPTITSPSRTGEKAAEVLNLGFFSPRFIASRMQLLNPYTYYKLDPFTRKEAAKDMTAMLGMVGSGLTLAKAAGAEVTADPTSSDFGKIKVNNTRYDLTGGFGPYMRFFAQAIKGGATGEGGPDLSRFVRSKQSPAVGITSEVISGKDFFGQPQSRFKAMSQAITPMIISDVAGVMQNDPEQSLPAGLAAIAGIPVAAYDTDKKSSGSKSSSKGSPARSKRKKYKP